MNFSNIVGFAFNVILACVKSFQKKQVNAREMSSELEKRKFIVEKFIENPLVTVKKVAREVKVNVKTVSNVMKKYLSDLSVERKTGSGRLSGYKSPKRAKKVVSILQKKPNLSNRKLAAKAGYSEGMVRKIKKKEGLKTYKVQSIPDRNAEKNQLCTKRARKLKNDFFF